MENDPDFIEDPRQGRGNAKLKNRIKKRLYNWVVGLIKFIDGSSDDFNILNCHFYF